MSEPDDALLSLETRVEFAGFTLDVSQSLALDGVVGLFGPSGGGKSTLLRVIAGLERQAHGRVSFRGRVWQDTSRGIFLPAHQRPVGYVFQDARLFPHLTVAGNLNFARRRAAAGAALTGDDEVLATMNIAPLMQRHVGALSGGERQRVAIARALLAKPLLLLLDEPLAALDVGRKSEILPYLENLTKGIGIPAIFVSHAVNEMARLADTVIVLEAGRISAVGSASAILGRESLQLSTLPFEALTVLEVTVAEQLPELHLTRVTHDAQAIVVPELKNAAPGDTARLTIRAGDVIIATAEPRNLSVRNVLRGVLGEITPLRDSAFAMVSVDVGGSQLQAQLTQHSVAELGLVRGLAVYALVKTASFDRGV